MEKASRRQKYSRLDVTSSELQVANELRELANRASVNSARALETFMRDKKWKDAIGHTHISDVLAGENAANKLPNVLVVARALVRHVPGMDEAAQEAEVRRIQDVYEEAFKPPRIWSLDFTRHCSNAAFDWASELPYGPRDAHELVVTVAIRDDTSHVLRTEVLGRELAEAILYEVMQAAPARKVGNASRHLPNDGWTCNGDDGPTWHGMWGPVGTGRPAARFLAIRLDAIGAVSVYLRVAVSTGIEPPELRLAALETAFQIVCLIGWRGRFGVLARSVSPSSRAQKHREYALSQPSRDGKAIIPGPARWTTHGKTVEIPHSLHADSYRYWAVATKLARQLDGLVIDDEDSWPAVQP